MSKQIVRVLLAYEAGCRTTLEVSRATGLSLKLCAAYSTDLVETASIRKVGKAPRRFEHGRRPFVYELCR